MKKKKKVRQNKFLKGLIIFFIISLFISGRFFYIKNFQKKPLLGIVCAKSIEITSPLNSKIEKVLVKENSFVKKNDELILLDNKLIDSKIKQLDLRISYENEKMNFFKFNENKALEEYLNIKKDETQEIKEINNKLKKLEEKQLSLKIQKAKINMFKHEKDFLNEIKNNKSISSPCDGVVSNVFVLDNQNINLRDKMLAIINTDNMWIETKIEKKNLFKYPLGDSFAIFIKDFPKTKFQGKIFDIKSIDNDVYIKLSINQIKQDPKEIFVYPIGMQANLKHD